MPSYTRLHAGDETAMVWQELSSLRASGRSGYPLPVARLQEIVPFDGFSFSGLDVEGCELGRGAYLATNLPERFTSLYTRDRLIEADPMGPLISPETPTASWDAIDSVRLRDSRTQRLCHAMKLYDVAPRTVFSLWKKNKVYGAATFTRRKPFTDSELETLAFFSGAIHSALAQPVIDAVNARLGLLKGEILCLTLAAEGLTSEEIAVDTGYAVATVNTYLKTATRKLKSRNRSQAIAEALRRKIIQ